MKSCRERSGQKINARGPDNSIGRDGNRKAKQAGKHAGGQVFLRQNALMNAIRSKHRLRPIGGRSSGPGFRFGGVVSWVDESLAFGKSRFVAAQAPADGYEAKAALNLVPVMPRDVRSDAGHQLAVSPPRPQAPAVARRGSRDRPRYAESLKYLRKAEELRPPDLEIRHRLNKGAPTRWRVR
jgi:hypothetical protein